MAKAPKAATRTSKRHKPKVSATGVAALILIAVIIAIIIHSATSGPSPSTPILAPTTAEPVPQICGNVQPLDMQEIDVAMGNGSTCFRYDITPGNAADNSVYYNSAAQGADWLGILDRWTLSTTNFNLTQWNQSVEASVQQYGGAVHNWEIWNEPIYNQIGYLSTYNGTHYYYMIRAAYNIIHAAYPNDTIVCFGGAQSYDQGTIDTEYEFYKQAWDDGASKYCNAISMHSYDGYDGVSYNLSVVEPGETKPAAYWWNYALNLYENLTHKPIWITETGYYANTSIENSTLEPEFVTQDLNFFSQYPFVKRVYWYCYCTGSFTQWGIEQKSAWSTLVKFIKGQSTSTTTTTSLSTTTIEPGSYYVPITITNPSSTATPSEYQQMITVPSSTYSTYINPTWNNVEFTTGAPYGSGGTPVYAWVESGASNSNSSTIVWLNLTSISGKGSITVYMNFVASPVMANTSSYTGEAPQLSPTYGEYDNGAHVFLAYFDGNTPPGPINFEAAQNPSINLTVSQVSASYGSESIKAIHLSGDGYWSPYGFTYQTPIPNQPIVAESNFQNLNSTAASGASIVNNYIYSYISALTATDMAGSSGLYFSTAYLQPGSSYSDGQNGQGTANKNWNYGTVIYLGNSASSWSATIAPQLYSSTGGYSASVSGDPLSGTQPNNSELYIGVTGYSYPGATYDLNINWMRARTYLAGGMPTASFGSVTERTGTTSTTSVTSSTTSQTTALSTVTTTIPSNAPVAYTADYCYVAPTDKTSASCSVPASPNPGVFCWAASASYSLTPSWPSGQSESSFGYNAALVGSPWTSGSTCSVSLPKKTDVSVAGLSVTSSGAMNYEGQSYGEADTGKSYTYTYETDPGTGSEAVALMVSCGGYACQSVTWPAGCSAPISIAKGYQENIFLALCNQTEGSSYSVDAKLIEGGAVIVSDARFANGAWGVSSTTTTTSPSTSTSTTSTMASTTTSASTSSTTVTSTTTSATTSTTTITSGSYYVPITISNPSSTATPSGFQEMIKVPSNAYSAYINPTWNNVEFTTGASASNSGTPAYAWIESGASNTNSSTVVWLNLPSIPSKGSTTVYMNFMGSTIMDSTSSYTGEAPQLSPTYGEYDNGAEVFLSYFNGNTGLSKFNAASGVNVTQKTGVAYGSTKINAINMGGDDNWDYYGASYQTPIPNQPIVAESNFQNLNNPIGQAAVGLVNSQTATSVTAAISSSMGYGSYGFANAWVSNSALNNINTQGSPNENWNYATLIFFGSNVNSWNATIAPQLYSSAGGYTDSVSNNPIGSSNIYLGLFAQTGPGTAQWNENINWMRARTYLAGGMPTASFGTVT